MKLNDKNLTNQTVLKLQEMIRERGIKPSEPLGREADIGKQLNVSRTVLREAVSRLRSLGILESRQCVGLVVVQPDPVKLFSQAFENLAVDALGFIELGEFRYILEIGAIELVARRATTEQLERIKQLAEEFARRFAAPSSNSMRSFDDIDLEFHVAILEASQNTMLQRMYNVISAYFIRSAKEVIDWNSGASENAVWEHRAIAEALQKRQIERSRALLAGHLAMLISANKNY